MTAASRVHRQLLSSSFSSSSVSSSFSSSSSPFGSSTSSLFSSRSLVSLSHSVSLSSPSPYARYLPPVSSRAPCPVCRTSLRRKGDKRCVSPFPLYLGCMRAPLGCSQKTRDFPRFSSFSAAFSSSPRFSSLSSSWCQPSSSSSTSRGGAPSISSPFSLLIRPGASPTRLKRRPQNLSSAILSLFSSSPYASYPSSSSSLSASCSPSSFSDASGASSLSSFLSVSPHLSLHVSRVSSLCPRSRSAFSSSPHSRLFRVDKEAKNEGEARRRWAVIGASLYFLLMSVAFAFVPLYEAFCQSTGYGGYVQIRNTHGGRKSGEEELVPSRERSGEEDEVLLEIDFASHCNVPWDFEPLQKRLIVAPGESALAFYRARNKLDRPVIGISLYNVMPPEAGIYFNKIQCFCFEEQMLNPHEEVDMPVFFFIDPDILDDPRLEQMKRITLSYVFNESDADIPEDYKNLPGAKPTDKKPPVVEI